MEMFRVRQTDANAEIMIGERQTKSTNVLIRCRVPRLCLLCCAVLCVQVLSRLRGAMAHSCRTCSRGQEQVHALKCYTFKYEIIIIPTYSWSDSTVCFRNSQWGTPMKL